MTNKEQLQAHEDLLKTIMGTLKGVSDALTPLTQLAIAHQAQITAHDAQIAALIARADKADAEARERGKALDERIGNLVSAIGELIRQRDGKRTSSKQDL